MIKEHEVDVALDRRVRDVNRFWQPMHEGTRAIQVLTLVFQELSPISHHKTLECRENS